jgi:ligand-binding sensor domain-containing protein
MGRRWRVSWWWVGAAGVALLLSAAVLVGWRASRALRDSREEVRAEHEIRFESRPFAAPVNAGFEAFSAPAVFLQAARFREHLFLAGPAGLSEYDLSGNLVKQFVPGRDLPSSPLVAAAPAVLADSREPELVLATAGDGLLAYNGRAFRQLYPQDPDVRAVTTILPVAAGHLLIGTKKRGVLLYDGKQISPLHPTLSDLYVTSFAGTESDLWIGTLSQGVFHWHAGTSERFDEQSGLPDRQVQAIAADGDRTYVGTALGVAIFDQGRFSNVVAPGVLATSLYSNGAELFVGSEDQGVIAAPLAGRRESSRAGGDTELSEVRQFFQSGDDVYVLSRDALYRMNARGLGWQRVLQPGTATLSDRNISALAADGSGRLWVGYFDRGLDILQLDSGRTTHVENEHVFCVNRILPDTKAGTVEVATANGLVRFNAAGSQEQVLTRADGLIADHVTDVALYRDGLAVATPAGLTFLDSNGARSMYAFHGLANNHVNALGVAGDELIAGTLGGLSVIEKEAVQTNYMAGSSGLKHNWITAVVPVGEEWMVGTYGAGILGMERSGHFHAFEKATGAFEVNPGAMLVTPRHVFAGSLGKGLYVYDRETSRWGVVSEGLPSLNVTAIAESKGIVYVGTDNGLVRIEEQKLHP